MVVVVLAATARPGVAGSGFAVRSQSTSALGMAQAGMSTGAGDMSTMIYNPATLAVESGSAAVIGLTGIITRGRFDDPDGLTALGTPTGGGDGGDNGVAAPLPSLHLGVDLADSLRAGLSITSLYGLGTYYDNGWAGRYHALDSELTSVVVQPTLAWRATPWLALGAGLQVQYVRARTTAAVDFGSIDVALTGGAFGGVPGEDDGKFKATTSDVDVGMSLGLLVWPWEGARIGFGYRSPVTHHLDGNASFGLGGDVGAGVAAATGAFRNTGVSSELRLPPNVYLGVQQELGHGVTVYGDVNWMGWSRLKDLTYTFDNPDQPDAETALPWKDSLFAALGMSWQATERLTLRAGAAWDQTPARGDGAATPAIPDGDAYWLASGAGYRLTDSMTLDAALGATFTESVDVDLSATMPGNAFRGDFAGQAGDAGAMFASIQLRVEF